MSFIRELNEAKRQCANLLHKRELDDAALALDAAITLLVDKPTRENMKALVGIWTRAECVLSKAKNGTPPGGAGGAVSLTPAQKAA